MNPGTLTPIVAKLINAPFTNSLFVTDCQIPNAIPIIVET